MGITIQKQHSGRRLSEASSVCTADPLNKLKESIGIISPKIRLLHFQNLQAMARFLSPRAVLRAVFLHKSSLSVTARPSQVPGVARLWETQAVKRLAPAHPGSVTSGERFQGTRPLRRHRQCQACLTLFSTATTFTHAGCYFHYTLQTETQPPTGQNLSCVNF